MVHGRAPGEPTRGLGERLRAARDARGLSVQAAASEAKISTGYLHKLESGIVGTPSPRVLERLAGALDLPYWTLMRLAGYVPEGDEPENLAPQPAEAARRSGDAFATNAHVVELLEAIRAELAELASGQAELRQAIAELGRSDTASARSEHA